MSCSTLASSRVTIRPNSRRSSTTTCAASGAPNTAPAKKFCLGLPGSTAPFKDFDPANLLEGKDDNTIRRFREAELTHSRVAMVASLGFLVGENFNPLFDGSITGPAINQFQQLPGNYWALIGAPLALIEYGRAQKGWEDPAKDFFNNFFKLKDDYEIGNLGWDPLGLKPKDPEEYIQMQNKELNNGRLAMFGIAGSIVQELVTGTELFNLEDDGVLIDANCPAGVVCDILEASG